MTEKRDIQLLWVGMHQPEKFSRDNVVFQGLLASGVSITRLIDSASSYKKFKNIARDHRAIRGSYDFVMVSYLSNVLVPLIRLISNRPIVFNALCSMYEGVVLDRARYRVISIQSLYYWLLDFVAFHSAHLVLVESDAEKAFLKKVFFIPEKKMMKTWTGTDMKSILSVEAKSPKFRVIFRGLLAPCVGIEYFLGAASLLRDHSDIEFLIRGRGTLGPYVREYIAREKLENIDFDETFLPTEALEHLMKSSHASFGLLSDHPRAHRTIANKTYESLMFGTPFVSARYPGVSELLVDNETALFVKPADSEDVAQAILRLKGDSALQERLSANGTKLFNQKLIPERIIVDLVSYMKSK